MTGKNRLRNVFDGIIRPARDGDLPAIMIVENSSFGDERYPPEDMDEYLQKSITIRRTPFLQAGHSRGGAEADIAGYVLGDMTSKRTGHIIGIAVMESQRGRQLGRMLLDRVSESLRNVGAQRIKLEVRAENEVAIRLYEAEGFTKTRDVADFYGPGQHGIEMLRVFGKERHTG